jgi:hypothetical protein
VRRNGVDLMSRRMKKMATSGSLIAAVLEGKEFAAKLPGRVNRVLDALAASELKMKVELIDDGAIIDGLQKVANRITLGLILAAMIVSAAMVMRVDTTFRILGYPGFAMILFLLAGAGATYLGGADRQARSIGSPPVIYRPPRPRSQPYFLRQQPLRRRPSYRPPPDPRHSKPKGILTAWTRIRRLLWSWWPWALLSVYYLDQHKWWAALGIGLWAGVCSLSTPAEFPPQYGLEHGLTVSDPEFLNSMAGAAGVAFVPGNSLALLNNGDRFYPAMLDAINGAKYSITIEAYIYWAGEIGMQFANALGAAARRGVRVKILLDAVGSASVGAEILKILDQGGCHVAWYNPFRIGHLRRINNRTHRKSLIIDGRIGFTGGAGIADHWTGDAQDDKHWRDLQIRIEGPAVRPLQTGFAQNWLEATCELVTGPASIRR